LRSRAVIRLAKHYCCTISNKYLQCIYTKSIHEPSRFISFSSEFCFRIASIGAGYFVANCEANPLGTPHRLHKDKCPHDVLPTGIGRKTLLGRWLPRSGHPSPPFNKTVLDFSVPRPARQNAADCAR
jgi:hypothetical protein